MDPARRRHFLLASSALLTAPLASFAQQRHGKVPSIGFLISETVPGTASRIEALRAGLTDRGYAEGKSITIGTLAANGNYERLPELATELVRRKVVKIPESVLIRADRLIE